MAGFDGVQAITLRESHRALRAFLALTPTGTVGDLHIATVGTWAGHPMGEFALTEEDIDHAVARFEKQRNPMMVDYDHKSLNLSGSPSDGLAAGWIQSLEKRMGESGAELWAKVEWTARASEAIKGGEYRYCSPVLEWESVDRTSGETVPGLELFNVAITNQPFLDGNRPIQLTRVRAGMYEDNLRGEQKPVPPPPPGSPPALKPEPEKPAVAAGPPPPPEPAPPVITPEQNAEDAQLTTAIDALMRVMQVDRPAVVAALVEYADTIGSMLNQKVERDGTPAEARKMSEKPADANAPPAGGAPPAADDQKRIEAIERKQSENQLLALKEQIEALKAKEDARTAVEAANAKKFNEQLVDHMIATGHVRDADREDAIWLFTTDPERAKRIYATQVVPIGKTQAGPNGTAPPAPQATPKPIDVEKATESDLLAHERPVFECFLQAGKPRQKALKMVLSQRDEIASNARKLGITG